MNADFVKFLLVVVSVILGLVSKIVYDFIVSGRTEKGVYMKIEDCQGLRDKCCIGKVKSGYATLETRVAAAEKRLDEGREDFKQIRKDIGEIGKDIAGMKTLLEKWLEGPKN